MAERELRILQAIECSSMVSTWDEYLCLEIRDGRAVLSHRRYDVLGEVRDFAVETDEGDEEYQIPDLIDGKPVVGIEDDFIVGGDLTVDPSDSESEIDLASVNSTKVRAWLSERGFDLTSELEEIWAGTAREGRVPSALGSQELAASDREEDLVEPNSEADIAPVTHLRIRLRRSMDFPASAENDYPAEVIKEGECSYYRARGVTVPITADEALQVISNPFLYYFSTALKLHQRIDQAMADTGLVNDVTTIVRSERMTEPKREVVLLRVNDPLCKREFRLVRTSRNRYALRFRQVGIYKEDRIRIPQARSLKSGTEIWEALVGMVTSLGAFEIGEGDVDEIAANAAMIDSMLAEELRRTALEWFTEPC